MLGSRTASYHHKTIHVFAAIAFMLWFLIFTPACRSESGTEINQSNTTAGIYKRIEKGPVSVSIDTDKKEMTVSERLLLTVSATCGEEWIVSLPDIDEKFGEFAIVDYNTTRPALTGKKQKTISRSYLLEPFLAGDYIIPPIHVAFRKDEKKYDIKTPEINIAVTSLFPSSLSKEKSELEIHDIKPPVVLPLSFSIWVWIVILFVIGILIVGLVIIFRRRRIKNGEEIRVDPAETALRELEKLALEKLEEKGESKRLYHRVSNILRRYIEQCFGIRAPEQTTEEFLTGLEKGSGFPDNYNRLLKDFLRYCDLVKFAELRPQAIDIQNAFRSCREFIDGTREKEH